MGGNIKTLEGVIDCVALKPKLPMTIYRRGALNGFPFPSSKQYALKRDIFKTKEGCRVLEKHRLTHMQEISCLEYYHCLFGRLIIVKHQVLRPLSKECVP